MYYVATDRKDWTVDDFYATARAFVVDVLRWAGPDLRRERMADIGCGAGRMLVHFAPEFQHVAGLDIAREMLAAASEWGMPDNVELHLVSGTNLAPLPDASQDFLFCTQVFQHIPDRDVLAAYIAETARVLRPGGRAMLHFDTRPITLARRLVLSLPDRLLPRSRRRYIRRYSVPAAWPAATAANAGLRLVAEREPKSSWHLHLLERT